MRIIDNIKNWIKPNPSDVIMSGETIQELDNLLKNYKLASKRVENKYYINSLGLNKYSFKAAVYDYVALHDSFNFDKFIDWLNE